MNLIKHHPERVQSAVLAHRIGRVGAMAPGRPARFNACAETLKDHPEATEPVLDAVCRNLYAPDFVDRVEPRLLLGTDILPGVGGQRRGPPPTRSPKSFRS